MRNKTDVVDRIGMVTSAAAFLIGIVVLGFVELLDGAPYAPVATTNDAGEVIATPLIPAELRVGFVVLGLVVLLLWGGFRLFVPYLGDEETTAGDPTH